jgi:hypothetical protein
MLVTIGDEPPGEHARDGLPVVHVSDTGVISRTASTYAATTMPVAIIFRRLVQSPEAVGAG